MAKGKITQLTVKDLLCMCQQQVAKGNGDKYLIAANDNEGNGYHGVFMPIEEANVDKALAQSVVELLSDSQVTDPDKLVIIG